MAADKGAIQPETAEPTYALGVAARLTGLSPDLLRAWERRYAAVEPRRTPGGTRRYRAADLERLRLLKAAVDKGYRIGEIANLDDQELTRRMDRGSAEQGSDAIEPVIAALERLDTAEADRLIALQLSALGPARFARQFAAPLLEALGRAWEETRICVASEHLGSGLLRSLLGGALRPTAASGSAPIIVFATPPGERHEMGLLIAAVTALGAGGNPLYLGPDLPVDEILRAVETVGAGALALSIVAAAPEAPVRALAATRAGLPDEVQLWVGGRMAREIKLPPASVYIDSLETLEQRVTLLAERSG
jgi:DNA-binding transcriptional MerR regulator